MKSSNNFKVLFIVSGLLLILSLSLSLINYIISLNSVQKELVNRALPLSVDNIYTEIQTHLIEPNLISSMMASDTFVKDWLINEEDNSDKITSYLETIRNKYGLFVTFLVSEKTKNYYTQKGFLESLDNNKTDNKWYFAFKDSAEEHEINLDYNSNLDNSLMMFINYKIFDSKYHFLGATGIGHKISYIDGMLKRFREEYKFKVCFLSEEGNVVLAERSQKHIQRIQEDPQWLKVKDDILSSSSKLLKYKRNSEEYILKTKYIPELHLYLLVEAKINDFTENAHQAFYLNVSISLFFTLIVTVIILLTIKKYNKTLSFMAQHDPLTELYNRRSFEDKMKYLHQLSKRNKEPLSFLFLDMDNFKHINDKYGHSVGDEVLKRVAEILQQHVRQTDVVARWGGEEFIVALSTHLENAQKIAEKLRIAINTDIVLNELVEEDVTSSLGITACKEDEPLEHVIVRVDNAMYEAKRSGKNRVISL
ncbi:sensor domain-containing diguanylate cyclase [Sulfurimonas sp. C5]|uniref:sensor domain-containing diguanylate cyclase n=1 Tax=Sulfurimonas sp. C5 TaxID=3036947 RepID=UPI0024570481|nr:sensor domain-containing diguanylate cyclase [Sulfurimonas sp. C5]MDH4945475.1 sensor domain-containing diguanylate cyclase [Sulfurimonas sp. C5]